MDIVKLIVDAGANINHENTEGMNSFMFASISGQKDIADYLRSRGADTSGVITDPKILAPLKQAGLIPEEMDGIPKKQLKYLKLILKQELGVNSLDDINNPDPKFSSPEKTWEVYKAALIKGNLELAEECHIHRNSNQITIYKKIGVEKTKELAMNFRPIEKVYGDKERCKYRIKRYISGNDITFYIYFANVFGEWKIEQF